MAHDYLGINAVGSSGKHYPLAFRRCRKRETCQAESTPFANHTALACALSDWVLAHDIPGTCPCASDFPNAEGRHHIHRKQRV